MQEAHLQAEKKAKQLLEQALHELWQLNPSLFYEETKDSPL